MASYTLLQLVVLCLLFQLVPGKAVTGGEECGVHGRNFSECGHVPWQVGLYKKDDNKWKLICGGTLISRDVIITAAHCLKQVYSKYIDGVTLDVEHLRVGLGKVSSDIDTQEPLSTIANVKRVVIPQSYAGYRTNYALDIALVQLTDKVTYNDHVKPACLDLDHSFTANGDRLMVSGWRMDTGDTSQTLKCVYPELVNCNEISEDYPLASDKTCARNVQGSGDIPKGNSGGGMVVQRDGTHFMVGVLSYTVSDPTYKGIAMFTDVNNIQISQWLKEELAKLK